MARPRTAHLHLPPHVVVHHGAFWYRPPSGDNIRIGAFPDEEHLVWKFMADKTAPVTSSPTQPLSEHFARYRREVVPMLAPRTQTAYVSHLEVLDKVFGKMKPDDVLPRDIGRFLDRPKGKIHANRQVAVFSAVYAKMVGRWYVALRNPCIGVERNPQKRRSRYITDIEFQAFYSHAKPRIQIAMDLALLTGQRQGDLLTLPWTNVTDEGILFRQGKTGKKLLVRMSPALQAVLDRAKALPPVVHIGGNVIRNQFGRAYTSEGFRACWQRTMQRVMRKQLLAERFTFHDIRAKTVSDSLNIQEAFERAGHTNMAMTRGTYDRGVRKVTPLK